MVSTIEPSRPVSVKGIDLDAMETEAHHKRVMIVDDEADTLEMVKLILTNAGIDVIGAANGKISLEKCLRVSPDIILLDFRLPEMDGFETFARIRKISQAPVIFLTARTQKSDLVKCLQTGADDYITKPYHPAELVARVQKSIRRSGNQDRQNVATFPATGLRINFDTKEAMIRNKTVALTNHELAMLRSLARRPMKWVPHETIGREIWGQDDARIRKRIKYLVFILRRKLEINPSHPKIILSRDGLGYKLAAV